MTTCLGKNCWFHLPQVPFVNCYQFMYLVLSLLVLRAGYGIWLYQFLVIAYQFLIIAYLSTSWKIIIPKLSPKPTSSVSLCWFYRWQEKIPMSKSPLESTWLYHEIGRCYLELNKYSDARDYGEKSLQAAKEAQDHGWQLHACVLVAQSEGE